MKKLIYSLLGIVVTRLVMSTMRKASRPRPIEQKVGELKNKFRSLDTV